MSLIYQNPNLGPKQTQTHVLVIGVGYYSHIVGGQAFDPGTPLTAGLQQLTSSVPSAQKFANWMIGHLDNPASPLGTVEVAMSPGNFTNENGVTIAVDSADFAGIKQVFNAWYGRCDQSVDNIAIFYFCGHGLEYIITMLLPEDFGASPNQLGDEIIDFSTTWYAMGECKAKTQLYLLDSCREAPLEIVRGRVTPRPLKSTTKMMFPPRDAYILHAAPMGQKAHAPLNSASYFTEYLIRCFEKLGVLNKRGRVWEVTTDMLTGAMLRAMLRAVASGAAPALCTRGGMSNFPTVIHHIPHPPDVMGEINCSPTAALPFAELIALQQGTAVKQRGQSVDTWQCDLAAGSYDLEARFPAGQYQGGLQTVIISPPFFKETIPVV